MNFTSPLFLIGFPVVCLIYRKLPEHKASGLLSRRTFLLLASWLFYMGGSLLCFPLLFLVTLITYLGGISIEKACAETKDRAKAILALVLFFVLSILFFFKYFGFVQDTLFRLTGMKSRGLLLPLPAGISFYSFQSLSYCLDVYRGRRAAERSFRDFALYVSFFPQLVAGPIERADDLLPQLKACPSPTGSDTRTGAFFILRGFFKKIVIADFLSVYVSALFDAERCSGPLTILAGILFGFQIYADFSGYSDIALGAARLLGIRLHMNFDRPYLADSIREFWRRWHITLTSWFTDYVYIPLGGSRRGTAVHVRNILIVFLLSGFWHGADWNHILWGLWFFVFISLERTRFGPFIEARPRLGLLYAQFVFFLSLPLFSYSSLAESGRHFARMFSPVFHTDILYYLRGNGVLLLIAMVFCAPSVFRVIQSLFEKHAALRVVAMGALMLLSMAALVNEAYNPFIYFRF